MSKRVRGTSRKGGRGKHNPQHAREHGMHLARKMIAREEREKKQNVQSQANSMIKGFF